MSRPRGSTNKTNVTQVSQSTTQIPVTTEAPINPIDPTTNFYIPRNYARSNLQPLWATSTTTSANSYTNDQINNFLKNPYLSYRQLQQASEYLGNTNSNYNNVLDYFSTIMTFDYILYPCGITENQTTIRNRFLNSAKIISKINLKNIFPQMLKRAILQGEAYFYDLSDTENTIIIEIPKEFCVLSHIDDDGLWRYYVDLSLITKIALAELPEEIQKAYKDYAEKGKGKSKGKKEIADDIYIPDSYYEVSKKGFAIMIHMQKKVHDYPLFSHMFGDLSLLNSDKSYFNEFIKDDAVKTIHLQVPTSEEGIPLMDKNLIESFHNSAKENVGRNISIMTNPFKTEGITLDGSQKSALNVVEHDINVVQNDSGISETIFNANTTNGLGYSTKADSARMYPLLYFFTNFVNYKIKQHKCQVEFLHVNIFEESDVHESYRADLLSGGSRSLFMATSNVDTYSYFNLVEMEKLLDFDSMLIPKMNSSQMNSDDLNNPNGRPKTKEGDKGDSTVVADGYK